MADGWRQVFQGEVDGRFVKLLYYQPSGDLRVETTQSRTEIAEGSFEPGSNVFPGVISKGDRIDIDASNADDLEQELRTCGFSESAVLEIVGYARNPGVPVKAGVAARKSSKARKKAASRRKLHPAKKNRRASKSKKK